MTNISKNDFIVINEKVRLDEQLKKLHILENDARLLKDYAGEYCIESIEEFLKYPSSFIDFHKKYAHRVDSSLLMFLRTITHLYHGYNIFCLMEEYSKFKKVSKILCNSKRILSTSRFYLYMTSFRYRREISKFVYDKLEINLNSNFKYAKSEYEHQFSAKIIPNLEFYETTKKYYKENSRLKATLTRINIYNSALIKLNLIYPKSKKKRISSALFYN